MLERVTIAALALLVSLGVFAGCGDAEALVGTGDPNEPGAPGEPAEDPFLFPTGELYGEGLGPREWLPGGDEPEPPEEPEPPGCDPDLDPDGCEAPEPLGPPYPVVLAHGFFGFDYFAGIDFISYFYKVGRYLAEAGEDLVFFTTVDPFNDSVTRGHQLIVQVEDILDLTGHEKVNLIGHSQGGLDSRVVAHVRPELVASVTTFATPHHGTTIADIALRLLSHDKVQEITDAIVQLAGAPLWDEVGEETSLVESLRQLSTHGAAEFNEIYTDQPDVLYFSVTGRSGMHYGWLQCLANDRPDFVRRYDLFLDPVDPLLLVTQQVLAAPFNLRPNDGLVRVEAAKWGRFLGCVPADHLDEIGHLFGAIPGLLNPWRHGTFYVDLVEWLREEGL